MNNMERFITDDKYQARVCFDYILTGLVRIFDIYSTMALEHFVKHLRSQLPLEDDSTAHVLSFIIDEAEAEIERRKANHENH